MQSLQIKIIEVKFLRDFPSSGAYVQLLHPDLTQSTQNGIQISSNSYLFNETLIVPIRSGRDELLVRCMTAEDNCSGERSFIANDISPANGKYKNWYDLELKGVTTVEILLETKYFMDQSRS